MEPQSHPSISPFSHPVYVMAKPAGAQCNLACRYCYYLEKAGMYSNAERHFMDSRTLELFVKQYIAAQTQREVLFVWHGGETMLRPLSFYREALRLQKKYAKGHIIDNSLQTNGTLITPEWCEFFKENNWLIGVSLDGPEAMHNTYRKDMSGKGSFEKVMRGVELLNRYGVEWNAMAVVNSSNASHPKEFYRFFKDIGCHYIQFTPIVERKAPLLTPPLSDLTAGEPIEMTAETVQPRQWGEFLCTIFDEWVAADVGEFFIQLFDATLANWVNVEPGVCSMAKSCGNALAMEYNGDVFSCDHFVYPEYKLGNIKKQPLAELFYGTQQNTFRKLKQALPAQCRRCKFEFACHGECPKNRLIHTVDGEAGLNFLCEGYKRFFAHVEPYMDFMAREWLDDGAPANVMQAVADGLFAR